MKKINIFILIFVLSVSYCFGQEANYELNEEGYYTSRGVDVLVFNNWYSGYFSDSKMSGIEIIHHGKRTVTNGDVRLSNTPEQWDPIPNFGDRNINSDENSIEATLSYPDYNFDYTIKAQSEGNSILVSVHIDKPLPEELEGLAGFNMEFLPSAYFGKYYSMDGRTGLLPRHPYGPMYKEKTGRFEASPLDSGSTLVMSPESGSTRISVEAQNGNLALYDGRNKAQNGWYVVRSLIPSNETGKVVEWEITPNVDQEWTRKPVIGHSQLGYHPDQKKVATIEKDAADTRSEKITVYKIGDDGNMTEKLNAAPESWGDYLRYQYAQFDFSSVTEPGLYVLKYRDVKTEPFRIAEDIYGKNVWQQTLDTFFPVQMDHMYINDRYRVWHGTSHLDDARQAPVDHQHFDLYEQGPETNTTFEPGEHIPGLNVGGWYDAGDYDIRTQSQYATILTLVEAYEEFDIEWDETKVEQQNRYVDLHHPDGKPDMLQQIEHGVLQLVSQYRAVGHALNGIVAPIIDQYTHMGDGATKTDNLIYDPDLDSLEVQGNRSGRPDDRWAFTNKSTPLDYGSIAALAAASRVLEGYNDTLATESFETAVRVWNEEQDKEPVIFESGNTTGGPLETEELKATVELLITTEGEEKYANRLRELLPYIEENFYVVGGLAVRAIPFMEDSYEQNIREMVEENKSGLEQLMEQNPYGVPITTGGWGGSGAVMQFGRLTYQLHQTFPDLISTDHTLRALEYILGNHPGNNISLVSGIGAESQTNAYGVNRADYSFIPGGVIPEGALFIYLSNAADRLVNDDR